jgi:hypothetical protein
MPSTVAQDLQVLSSSQPFVPFGTAAILTARFEELVIYSKRNQWHREPAEIVLHCRSDCMNIQVRIGDVVIIVGLETTADLIDLRGSTALAVNAFDVHA